MRAAPLPYRPRTSGDLMRKTLVSVRWRTSTPTEVNETSGPPVASTSAAILFLLFFARVS